MSVVLQKETNLYDTDAIQNGINVGVQGAIATYDAELNQAMVFNKLTNNGAAQGIFMRNGQLYINMSYLQTGTLKAGGANNADGVIQVYDANGDVVVELQRTGLAVYKGQIILNLNNRTTVSSQSVSHAADEYWIGNWMSTWQARYVTTDTPAAGTVEYNTIMEPAEIIMYKATYTSATVKPNDYRMIIGIEGFHINKNNGPDLRYYSNTGLLYGKDVYYVFTGTKSREVDTDDYGKRLLYCYETPSPMFGDVGEGVIADDGKCYVMIDSIFAETVSLYQYQVVLQKYGDGECWVSERKGAYFVVEGTPGLAFGWELKAKQSDFDQLRLEKNIGSFSTENSLDYGTELINHIAEIQKEREVA